VATIWRLPRLSKEWLGPITVTRDGDPVTGWTLAILPRGQQPTGVAAINQEPTTIDGELGVLVGPGTDHVLTPGLYRLWIRYADATEAPVINDVATIHIV
jgi:hypothetical protein